MKTILLIVMAAGLAAGQSTGRAPLQLAAARKPAADFALRDAAGISRQDRAAGFPGYLVHRVQTGNSVFVGRC